MVSLKNYKSVLLFSLLVFVSSILANILSSILVILTKIPPYFSAWIQYIIVIPLYIFFNHTISKQKIFIIPSKNFKFVTLPYILIIIFSLFLLRSNPENNNVFINDTFIYEIAYCIGSSISEEYFARGILFSSLLKINKRLKRKGIIIAIIIDSIIFSSFHIFVAISSKSFIQILVPFLLGIFFCSLYLSTHSIIPSILFHFVYNFTFYFLNNNLAGIHLSLYSIIFMLSSLLVISPVLLDKKYMYNMSYIK